MVDFGVIIFAHLVGDYLFQNDWMAQNKTKASLPCLVHVLIYTGVHYLILLSMGAAWPLWAFAVIGATHFYIDRTRFAVAFMKHMGQNSFRKHMAPWSIIIIDNTLHLAISFALWRYLHAA